MFSMFATGDPEGTRATMAEDTQCVYHRPENTPYLNGSDCLTAYAANPFRNKND
jgi:hypothetical protein